MGSISKSAILKTAATLHKYFALLARWFIQVFHSALTLHGSNLISFQLPLSLDPDEQDIELGNQDFPTDSHQAKSSNLTSAIHGEIKHTYQMRSVSCQAESLGELKYKRNTASKTESPHSEVLSISIFHSRKMKMLDTYETGLYAINPVSQRSQGSPLPTPYIHKPSSFLSFSVTPLPLPDSSSCLRIQCGRVMWSLSSLV